MLNNGEGKIQAGVNDDVQVGRRYDHGFINSHLLLSPSRNQP